MRVVPRRIAVDAALGLLLGWSGWAALRFARGGPFEGRPPRGPGEFPLPPVVEPSEWMVPALLLVASGVAVRRAWPRAGFVAVVLGLAGYLALGGSFGPVFLAPALVVYVLAVSLPLRSWVPLMALLLPMVVAGHWREPYLGALNPGLYAGLLAAVALAVLPAMFAVLRRVRRENEQRVRDQDRRRYVDEERLRIARDVHDVVGHSLSVISLQAGVALHVLDRQPEQVAESLEAIRRTSREALAELRTTLDVYRDSDGGVPLGLRPGLGRLDELVAALVGAGRDVRVARDGDETRPLPAAVDQAAFRIIQEALTNVVRHAGPSAAARVRVTRRPDRLLIEVNDNGPTVAPLVEGIGLRGMHERARAVGGTVQVGLATPSGVVVAAELPLAAEGAE
jgi:signal transduction histidine kinase